MLVFSLYRGVEGTPFQTIPIPTNTVQAAMALPHEKVLATFPKTYPRASHDWYRKLERRK